MKKTEHERRREVLKAARLKWSFRGIALDEVQGVWTLKGLTGKWTLDTSVTPSFARETSIVYWTGASLEAAEKEVGL